MKENLKIIVDRQNAKLIKQISDSITASIDQREAPAWAEDLQADISDLAKAALDRKAKRSLEHFLQQYEGANEAILSSLSAAKSRVESLEKEWASETPPSWLVSSQLALFSEFRAILDRSLSEQSNRLQGDHSRALEKLEGLVAALEDRILGEVKQRIDSGLNDVKESLSATAQETTELLKKIVAGVESLSSEASRQNASLELQSRGRDAIRRQLETLTNTTEYLALPWYRRLGGRRAK